MKSLLYCSTIIFLAGCYTTQDTIKAPVASAVKVQQNLEQLSTKLDSIKTDSGAIQAGLTNSTQDNQKAIQGMQAVLDYLNSLPDGKDVTSTPKLR